MRGRVDTLLSECSLASTRPAAVEEEDAAESGGGGDGSGGGANESGLQWNPADRRAVDVVNKALHPSTAPDAVLCRKAQCTQVCDFVFGQLQKSHGGSMYVAGPPGTGKSLAMARLTAQLQGTSTTVLNFNCMSVKDSKDIYSRLLQTLLGSEQAAAAASTAAARSGQHTGVPPDVAALQSLLCAKAAQSSSKQLALGKKAKPNCNTKAKSDMFVLILDEMDALITKEQEVRF